MKRVESLQRQVAPGKRWIPALALSAGMVLVPLLSLRHVHTGGPATVALRTEVVRETRARASRSSDPRRTLLAAEVATTPPTTEPPTTTTAAPVRVVAKPVAAKTPATTAKPRPKPKPVPRPTTTTEPPPPANVETGGASYFTAPAGTCAHRTAPIGTMIRVINIANGKATTCRVADRGPFAGGRVIDLARDTFAEIAPVTAGVVQVRLEW